MLNLTAHHLRFALRVETTIDLDKHPGSSLRGMLYNALRGPRRNPALGFCTQRHLKSCVVCSLGEVCPVASLVAAMNPQAERGRDVPRPYTIAPPLADRNYYQPGQSFTFGLTLFGQALRLFPYVVMALYQAGPGGLGRRLVRPEGTYRGRFVLQSAQAVNLLTGELQDILEPDNSMVRQPAIPVTPDLVEETSRRLLGRITDSSSNGRTAVSLYQRGTNDGPAELTLRFKTPTRIIHHGELLKEPLFSPLYHRLLDRLAALQREFGQPVGASGPAESETEIAPFDKDYLLGLSDQVELVANYTRWEELWSYSSRQQRRTPISGLLGQAVYRADRSIWERLLPYLLWGVIIHVGKNTVKGEGMIGVEVG